MFHALHIYVSDDGMDGRHCGNTISDACKNLDYVLHHFGEVVDTIIMNGGTGEAPMKYKISLSRNITFTAFNQTKNKPIITQSIHSHSRFLLLL